MKKIFAYLLVSLSFINVIWAQTPDWSENIAPIIYNNCTKCHHPGGIGKYSFMDYVDVKAMAYTIKYDVETKKMPPWPADPTYRHYAGERILKQTEIDAIVKWVNDGTPEGDISKAPAKPVYSRESKIGAYDLKVKMPLYTSTAGSDDVYRCFSIPINLTSDKYISAIEIIPGNPKIVHHVLLFQDTTNQTDILDANDPLPGYTNFGGTGSNNSILVAPYVPGAEPITFPRGTGVKLFKNARIILQIHYPKGTESELDSTALIMRFSNDPGIREVYIAPILHHGNITNGPLVIPKDQVKTFNQTYTIPINATLLSVMPHMHLIGRTTKVYIKPPSGDTIPLVRINDWNFKWQGEYRLQYLQKVTIGSKVQSIVTYDNTLNNPNQPSNPTKTVSLGEATTSEMMLTYFYYMFYQTGDEKILQDSSLLTTGIKIWPKIKTVGVYPNPVHDKLYVDGFTGKEDAQVQITDCLGRVMINKDFATPDFMTYELSRMAINVESLRPGVYSLLIQDKRNGKQYQNKFIKQ